MLTSIARRGCVRVVGVLAGCASSDRLMDSSVRSVDRPECPVSGAHEGLPASTGSGQPCRDDSLQWSRGSRDKFDTSLDFGKSYGKD